MSTTFYIGIAMHKYVLSFCLGLELFTGSGRANRFWVNLCYILLYALMSPIGIGIGIAVTQEANETLSGEKILKKNGPLLSKFYLMVSQL